MATLAAPSRPMPRKASRLWWHIHHWVGFKLALFMSFICLSGTLAVLANEIDWLTLPSLRVAPASVHGEPAWQKIALSAAAHPDVKQVTSISEPTASAFAAKVMIVRRDSSFGYLHVHPTTGVVQGEGHYVNAQRILRNLHRHLNLPLWIGIPLVTSLSILLLVSFVTSFVVYKKWWRGFLRPPRARDARTWWGDFHRLAGVWSLWFVALITFTGLWYFVEEVGAKAPVPQVRNVAAYPGDLPAIAARLGASLAAARAADPGLHIESIRFPTEKSGAFVFGGQKAAILVRPRANAVWTEAGSARVLASYDARDLGIHQRISEMADPLHFGTFGGYWTKTIWFLFGALLTALCVSGMAIYALRIGRELKQATPFRRGWRHAWLGMGQWRWFASACVITGLALIPTLFWAAAE